MRNSWDYRGVLNLRVVGSDSFDVGQESQHSSGKIRTPFEVAFAFPPSLIQEIQNLSHTYGNSISSLGVLKNKLVQHKNCAYWELTKIGGASCTLGSCFFLPSPLPSPTTW